MERYSAPKKMKKLGDLFTKYQERFKPPQATVEKAFVKAVAQATGHTIKEEMVVYTVSSQTISLNVPSVLKTEIKFKQQAVFECMKKELGDQTVPKIIF